MVEQNSKEKQGHKGRPRKRLWLSAGLAAIVFVTIGLLLSITAFFMLNIFVQGIIAKDYDQANRSTVEKLVRDLEALHQSVDMAAAVLSIGLDDNPARAAQHVRGLNTPIKVFDQVSVLHAGSNGSWAVTDIFKKTERDQQAAFYHLRLDQAFLSHLGAQNMLRPGKAKLLVSPEDKSLFTAGAMGMDDTINATPFAMIKAFQTEGKQTGVLVAVGHAAMLFNQSWLKDNPSIARLTIRDVSAGAEMYNMQHMKADDEGAKRFGQVYEFNFGGHTWEIRTEFFKDSKVYFLEVVPYFIIIFGFTLTAIGTLYIYSNQKQAIHTSYMNKVLEQKNAELGNEIRKRERLNKIINRKQRENKAVIDSVSDIIFETDTVGKIVFLNATWQKVTGFDPAQSMGLEFIRMLHPEDQDKQRKDFQLLVAGKKSAYRSFTRLRTSQGTFRAVEMAISMIRQDESKNLRVVGTFTDVEERRRAERALSEAEKKYRTIVENTAGGIFQLTPEGLYLSANPALARILGYDSPEDLLHSVKNANESVYANMRERQIFLKELEQRGSVNNYEVKVFQRGGTAIWVNENIRAVRDETGNTLYYEGSMEDITQRKQADLALREAKIHSDLANRAKSEFLANMSHELRTPLNAIIGFSEIMINEVFGAIGPKAYKEYIKDIHESGRNLLNIINEILDISKIEAGERKLNEGLVDVADVLGTSLNLLKVKAKASQLTITNDTAQVPALIGEEVAIKQILMNLLSNAIKFTPNGGRVTIGYETTPDGALRLYVTDTGIGLDESEIEKALSPFGQVDSTFSKKSKGTGLGLTLVNALIKLHGGKLELFSQKGIGTTASVIFPPERVALKKDAVQEESAAQASSAPSPESSEVKV